MLQVVRGSRPLILRERCEKNSAVLCMLPPGSRLQLHELREMSDGTRARVRVVSFSDPVFGASSKLKTARPAATARLPAPALPVGEQLIGWVTAWYANGRRMLVKRHLKLDANERRRQLELWNKRTFDEKALMQLQGKEKAQGKEKEFNVGSSFVHELAEDPRKIAFACGGVFPGTLHAHGALIKTHQVSYSVGAAGKYLMHVGLRQQSVVLPGSPFALEVKPGPAHTEDL